MAETLESIINQDKNTRLDNNEKQDLTNKLNELIANKSEQDLSKEFDFDIRLSNGETYNFADRMEYFYLFLQNKEWTIDKILDQQNKKQFVADCRSFFCKSHNGNKLGKEIDTLCQMYAITHDKKISNSGSVDFSAGYMTFLALAEIASPKLAAEDMYADNEAQETFAGQTFANKKIVEELKKLNLQPTDNQTRSETIKAAWGVWEKVRKGGLHPGGEERNVVLNKLDTIIGSLITKELLDQQSGINRDWANTLVSISNKTQSTSYHPYFKDDQEKVKREEGQQLQIAKKHTEELKNKGFPEPTIHNILMRPEGNYEIVYSINNDFTMFSYSRNGTYTGKQTIDGTGTNTYDKSDNLIV